MKRPFSRPSRWSRTFALGLLLGLLFGVAQPAALQSEPARDFAGRLNQARLAEGLAPLSWSTLLAQAAQRHADDLAAHNLIDSTGSDGSTYRQRIRETGYRAWNDGLLVYETFWVGLGNAENALDWFHNDATQWSAFVDPRYREVGVGYAESQNLHYFVISFGSRPGVLPVFINEGAETTDRPQVVIHLTNEEAVPLGEGRWIGQAIEVRLGETPDLEDAPWQPWEPLLPWAFSNDTPGDYAVYVEFRDGAGRTTISQDTVRLTAPGEGEPLAPTVPHQEVTPPPEPTVEATTVPTSEPPVMETPVVTAPPTPIPTLAVATPTPAPTAELLSTPALTPTPVTALVSERRPVDWPLVSVVLLQGIALLLGLAAFLRRK